VIASGTLMVSNDRPATEASRAADPNGGRAASETRVLEARGVRGSVVRLPPPVHDHSRAGLLSMMVPAAKEKGVAAYIGDGANLWPSVHRFDAARVFCLALEKAEPGSALHAVAEEGIPMRDIAGAIGEGLGIPVRSIAIEDAAAHLGLMGGFFAQDNLTTSNLTRQMLGWQPREIGLLEDLRQGVATWEPRY
jgi:nucleoside-diphosphate-sugar epimerase